MDSEMRRTAGLEGSWILVIILAQLSVLARKGPVPQHWEAGPPPRASRDGAIRIVGILGSGLIHRAPALAFQDFSVAAKTSARDHRLEVVR
ncbi:hypothetical protein CSOJ01_04058 [Colletotrichum sojae]|uniref:Uncharacterized protein n=1 Tax=Colletotrichum sojae TaxID=2175907 RepID=A0A8H6JKA7_9PEZI|nr:hypothetical protein CSOJ01_04058 [Colletotrichum sojae]